MNPFHKSELYTTLHLLLPVAPEFQGCAPKIFARPLVCRELHPLREYPRGCGLPAEPVSRVARTITGLSPVSRFGFKIRRQNRSWTLGLLVLLNVLLELLVAVAVGLALLFKLRLVLADERHLVLSFQVVELLAHADLLVTFGLDGGDANLFFGGGLVESVVLAQLLSQRGFLGDGACRARGEAAV